MNYVGLTILLLFFLAGHFELTVGARAETGSDSGEICLRSADPYAKWQDWQEGPARVNTPELRDGNASQNLSPAEIIHYSARENDINPVLLLAKLQDEQSLLTQGKGYSNAAGDFENRLEKATGLGVYDSGATPKWFGFYPQLVGSSYQWHLYREQGLTFQTAYETYTTAPGKYDEFTRPGGLYENAAARMNRIAGTAYDTRPGTYGYYNDFRVVTLGDIQRFLDECTGDLGDRNLFGEAPVSTSVTIAITLRLFPAPMRNGFRRPMDSIIRC